MKTFYRHVNNETGHLKGSWWQWHWSYQYGGHNSHSSETPSEGELERMTSQG